MEKDVGDKDGGDDAGQVGDQSGRDGITRLADAHRAEVQGHDIEGGGGRALAHASQAANERVDAVGIHGVDHHGFRAGTAERLHHGGRQGGHEVRIDAQVGEDPVQAFHHKVENARVADHADGHQHADQIGNHGNRSLDAAFRAFDESVIDIHAFAQRADDEDGDHADQYQVADHLRYQLDFLFCQVLREIPDQRDDGAGHAAQPAQHDPVDQIDALLDGNGDDADHGGHIGGDHAGNKDVRRIGRAQDRALRHDGQGN